MTRHFTDVRGRTLDLEHPPRRVVSLVPSVTETLFDLGAGASVVGVTDYCIFPAGLDLPRVGGTKNPAVDRIRQLAPDLVHMNLEENLRRHGDEIEAFAPLFVSEPKDVAGVREWIATLGAIHGTEARAAERIRELDDVRAALPRRPFTFACPIWKGPWMWCGGDTYVSALVSEAGGRNVLARHERYPALELAAVLALAPDLIFLPDEPFPFTKDDAEQIELAIGGTSRTTVVGPFPGHLFTWHGTRTILGLRWLAATLEIPGL